MKYRKILLAYNGSQEGKRALLECADLASFLQAETHLLAVASRRCAPLSTCLAHPVESTCTMTWPPISAIAPSP